MEAHEPESRAPLPGLAFREKLIEEVKNKLEKAVEESGTERTRLLQQLFKDVALEVDSRARAHLYGQKRRKSSRSVSPVRPLCYYEVLAEHYLHQPDSAKEVVPFYGALWSQFFTFQIFALLMHQWLFDLASDHADETVRFAKAFVNGANNVFWIDVQGDKQLFKPLFLHTLYKVLPNSPLMTKMPSSVQRDLFALVSRFFFFYEDASMLRDFFRELPASTAVAVGGSPIDAFVTEVTNQLQKIKVEPVLLRYLKSTQTLKGMALRRPAQMRLQTALYSMTSPGGPMYPPRSVRHAAFATLDCLFPVGRRFRHLISYAFRLLHPYYWPGSFLNFVLTKVMVVLRAVQDCWHWFWHLFEPQPRVRRR